eukprot:381816-Prymnesium_polylepis.1
MCRPLAICLTLLGAVEHDLVVRVELVVVVVARVEEVFERALELILGPQEADLPLLNLALLVIHVDVAAVAVATVLGGLEWPLQ